MAANATHLTWLIPTLRLLLICYSSRYQLLVSSCHPRWDFCPAEAATESHHLHIATGNKLIAMKNKTKTKTAKAKGWCLIFNLKIAGRTGNGLCPDPLSGCIYSRGSGHENQPDRGSGSGKTPLSVIFTKLCKIGKELGAKFKIKKKRFGHLRNI